MDVKHLPKLRTADGEFRKRFLFLGPVGLRATTDPRLDPGPGEQPGLKGVVGEVTGQGPAQPLVRGSLNSALTIFSFRRAALAGR